MLPAYPFEKARDMLLLGYVLRVIRVAKNKTVAYISSTDDKQALGRVRAEVRDQVRDQVLDELPLRCVNHGRWVYDYAADEARA